ncbi:hypothetical protein D3C76_872510 [compost metagenome]
MGCDLGVGGDVAEHGGHVRADHACTLADAGDGNGHAIVLELAAGTLGQGVGGHDAGGGFSPVVFRQVVQGGLQGAFDLLDWQRLADHTGGKWQYRLGRHAGQLGELGAGALGSGQARCTGTGVGVAGVGQQVTHSALNALLGEDNRSGAKGVEGEHASDAGAFGTAHDHHILAPRALDAGRSDAEFKTRNRVQGGQRTKTNSH